MKKLMLVFLVSLGFVSADIDIILEEEIDFANSQGVISSNVIYNNQMFQAYGTYRVDKDLKATFEIDRLMKGQKLSLLNTKPKLTKRLNDKNAKLPKGTPLTLKNNDNKEFKAFSEEIKNLENAKSGNKATKSSGSAGNRGSGSSSGGGSIGGGSIGGGSIGGNTGGNSGISTPPYTIPTYTTTTTDPQGNISKEVWNSQFCEVPEFLENAIRLKVIDKDGSCVEKIAIRDDTRCEYRFDFANNKAIKQTQFYYVDNENKVQNVGDCIDLVGEEYAVELYKDDTRCSLEHIDKDYNGGRGSFFVTQILFRGIDGLIHEATDCIAYGNIQEELVDHIKDPLTRTAQRIVNQYYIDPYTSEKVYLTKGVRTESTFNYTEQFCGDWEMDDVLLKGKKRTEIVFYDDVEYQKFNVTDCDYSVKDGKKSEYVVEYQNISATYKEQELSRKTLTHQISKQEVRYNQVEWEHCKKNWMGVNKCSGTDRWNWHVSYDSGKTNWTVTYITKDITDYETYLRPDGSLYQKNKSPNGEIYKRVDREVRINKNDNNLNDKWLLYWEIHNKYYTDPTLQTSTEYNSWVTHIVKKNGCQEYTINNGWTSGTATCNASLNYILKNL